MDEDKDGYYTLAVDWDTVDKARIYSVAIDGVRDVKDGNYTVAVDGVGVDKLGLTPLQLMGLEENATWKSLHLEAG